MIIIIIIAIELEFIIGQRILVPKVCQGALIGHALGNRQRFLGFPSEM